MVQIANPSGRHVHLKLTMLSGCIMPVTSVLALNVSTIQTGSAKSDSTRDELRTALKDYSKCTTLSADRCSQLLDLCTKYRSVFSLSPPELAKCTIAEAEYPYKQEHNLLIHQPIAQAHVQNSYRQMCCTCVELSTKKQVFFCRFCDQIDNWNHLCLSDFPVGYSVILL